MKKFFGYILLALSAILVWSCEPAESGFTQTIYIDNIFTVNKHTLRPEFEDTTYMMQNMASYPLQTGDRARIIIKYYYDAYSGKLPEWNIVNVVEKIPTRSITAQDSAMCADFTTPFTAINYYELMDRFCNPLWVWNDCQNINITYKGVEEGAEFAMVVRGVADDCLELQLLAKANTIGEVETTKLLTFDLKNVGDFLSKEQKDSVAGIDSLRTRIYFQRLDKGELREVNVIGGTWANPFK